MPVFHTPPFRRSALALTVGLALCAAVSPDVFAADGAGGTAATPDASAQGGGGGDMDLTSGIGGNGGAGGAGGRGQASSNGESGKAGSINNTPSPLPAGSGGQHQEPDGSASNGDGAAGGGGGGGSAGMVLDGSGPTSNSGSIVGGDGGRGGNGGSNTTDVAEAGNGGNGGNGGSGGSGVLITTSGSYANSGTISGGNGGNGGNTGSASASASTDNGITLHAGSGGAGGKGGDGITANKGGTINNTGTISGGRGATGGLAANASTRQNDNVTGVGGTGGLAADGGNGVWLSDTSALSNSGQIVGGLGGDGGNGGAVETNQGAGVVGYGAAGGNGGSGITVVGSGSVTNLAGGSITGGNAGTGGGGNSTSSGQHLTGGDGGDGGHGGSGISLRNGGEVANFGTVTGGAGNRGGGSGNLSTAHGGDSGAGGIGIEIIDQGNVTNETSGTVRGGKGGDDSAGGGGLGGTGGTAVSITGAGNVLNNGQFTGGDGGAGANANGSNANGGTGAEGGNGLTINGKGTVTNAAGATVHGGKGGTGGGGSTGTGGQGGEGGNGVQIGAGGSVNNDGTILGGTGNRGGGGGGANGGNGGDGVHITTGGGTLANSGTISGGQGGNAGSASSAHGTGSDGAGGIGVYGSDMTIINSGTLEGGLSSDGNSRSAAVEFSGGSNSLELHSGFVVTGDVKAGNGDDTLILGGDRDARFDASLIGDGAQYQGFDHFSKTGSSIWQLTDATDATTPWTLYDGVLAIARDDSLGNSSSTLTFNGGTLRLDASVDLADDRPVVLDAAGGTLDTQAWNTTIHQGIGGSGGLTKTGSGALTLSGDSSYRGDTLLDQGSIDVTGSLISSVTARAGTALSGSGSIGGATLDEGSSLTVGSPTQDGDAPARFVITGALHNDGTVNLARGGSITGNRLNVGGDYDGGSASRLNLNTVLGDDNSLTDRLTINGSTAGATVVSVSNVGGQGALTQQGIEVIAVSGNSAGTFTQAGRIVAGPWDYSLVQKGQNWYLTSVDTTPLPPPDEEDNSQGNTTPPAPPTEPSPSEPQVRPEVGSYLMNLAAANTLFSLSLDDREGATEYRGQQNGRGTLASTFWLRQEGGQNRFRAAAGQVRSRANRYVAQMGNEFLHGSRNGEDRWGAGLMAGYGDVSGQSWSTLTGYRSRNEMNGYSVGSWGTWYQHAISREGLYVDGWLNYNWFNNRVAGDDLPTEYYKSRGFTASVETGYNLLLRESERQAVYLEPQAQLTWMGVKSPDHTEANGTRIQDHGQGNLQSRLGMRLYLRGHRLEDEGKGREFKPYVEADWLHNTHLATIRMGNDLISQQGAQNVAQLKLGVQGQLSPALNLWGGTALQVGDRGYSDASAMIGMKYAF